jgi:phage FluMu gp28-like protein
MDGNDVTFQDLYDEYAHLPRSERVAKIFNFEPTDYQAELLDHHEQQAKTQSAPKKGRQVGASLVGSALAADYALWTPGADVLITSAKQDPADELFDKFTEHYKNSDLTLSQLGVEEDNKTEWTFTHGTRVLCRTLGQGDLSQRSLNPSFVIVDEAAYASDYHLEEVIEPYFITHPEYEFYLFSTPKGKSGYFYHAVEGNREGDWFSPHWPTKISPFADQDYLERKREEKDATTFAQEYRGEFADTGEVWIPSDLFRSCVTEESAGPITELVYLFVDVARKGKDRTVYLLMGQSGTVYDVWAENTSTIPGIAGRIKSLHNEYGFEQAGVDENAVGGGVVDDEGLQDIVTGVKFTTQSKDKMYRNLKTHLEAGKITIPADVDYYTKLEQETTGLEFDFTQNGYLKVSHPTDGHDDFADALAGANYLRDGMDKQEVRRKNARVNMNKGKL